MATLCANINTLEATSTTKLNNFDMEGLKCIKQYIEEYLRTDLLQEKSFADVRRYMEKVKVDDELLDKFLRGRKHDPFIAWDTIRRYAENKFHYYREIFPHNDPFPKKIRQLVEEHVVGIFRHRDKFGRVMAFIDMSKWDPNVYTLGDMTMAAVLGCEHFWQNPEVLSKGVILVENTQGFGLAHAKQHTLHNVMRMRNVFMYSYPVGMKGIYHLNMPKIFNMIHKMTRSLLPKKLRSRIFLYSPNQTPTDLFDIAAPEILPTWAGGTLSIEEAAEDIKFFEELIYSCVD